MEILKYKFVIMCMWVKTQSKDPPKCVNILLNYILVCLKDQKGNITVWIVIKKNEIFFINCKVYMLKSKMFLHGHSTQTSRVDNPYFFQTSFFLPNVQHSLWKLKMIITLMNRKAKGLELMFGTNVFDPKNYEFWKCGLNKKIVHIYVMGGMNT